MSLTLGGRNPLAYIGVEPLQPPNLVVVERNPISGAGPNADWRNFNVGTFWLNPINQTLWILVSKFSNIPFWLNLGISPFALVEHFTTDDMAIVNPLNFNVNVFGDGNIITNGATLNTIRITLNTNLVLNNLTVDNLTVNNTTNLLGNINTNLPQGVVQSPGGGGALFSNEGTDGQVLISRTGGAPVWNTLTAGAGISITNGPNSILITNTGGGGGGLLATLTGNDLVPVSPVANNINLVTAHATIRFLNAPLASNNLVMDFIDPIANNLVLGSSLLAFAGGADNTGVGGTALDNITTGSRNAAFGSASLSNVTSGQQNTAIGTNTAANLVTGSFNTILGYGSGSAYNNAQSSNILIANTGDIADANTIRIGNQGGGLGQQNRNFQAGIAGVVVANTNMVTIDTVTGQLGSQAVPGGGAGNASILITTYNTPGVFVFNKQPTSKELHLYGWHGGGGGGSGNTTDITPFGGPQGGTGGGAGGGFFMIVPSSFVSPVETVIVGAGGPGGAAVATPNTIGNFGTAGGKTQFGQLVISTSGGGRGCQGRIGAITAGNSAAFIAFLGGTSAPNSDFNLTGGRYIGTGAFYTSTSGGVAAPNGQPFPNETQGQAGGDITSPDGSIVYVAGGLPGNGPGSPGSNGNNQVTTGGRITGGSGGGGGGQPDILNPAAVGAGGAGGNGGFPGGGGGAGGGGTNGFSSGKGGNGGDGLLIIIEYF